MGNRYGTTASPIPRATLQRMRGALRRSSVALTAVQREFDRIAGTSSTRRAWLVQRTGL